MDVKVLRGFAAASAGAVWAQSKAVLKRIHATVRGRVQGVGFRDFVSREARSLGLAGWVRNCPDGSVEVVAEGAEARLERLAERLRTGPPMAAVASVDVRPERATCDLEGFSVDLMH